MEAGSEMHFYVTFQRVAKKKNNPMEAARAFVNVSECLTFAQKLHG